MVVVRARRRRTPTHRTFPSPQPVVRVDSDLVFLLAVGAFYLLRHLSGAKRKPAPGVPAPGRSAPLPPLPGEVTSQPDRDPEFDEALLEIRRALGMPVPEPPRRQAPAGEGSTSGFEAPIPTDRPARAEAEPRPRVLPSSPEPSRPRPAPRQTSLPSRIPTRPTRRVQRVEDEFHDPSKTKVAPKPPAKNDPFAWHDPLADHAHVDAKPEVVKTAAKPPHPLHARLKSKEVLREALLLREILGPPLSRRRR